MKAGAPPGILSAAVAAGARAALTALDGFLITSAHVTNPTGSAVRRAIGDDMLDRVEKELKLI